MNWSLVDLQCFRYTAKRFSFIHIYNTYICKYVYIYIHSQIYIHIPKQEFKKKKKEMAMKTHCVPDIYFAFWSPFIKQFFQQNFIKRLLWAKSHSRPCDFRSGLGCLPHRAYTLGETLHYTDSLSLCFHNTKAQLKLLKPKRSLLPTPSFSTWKTLVPGFLSDLSKVTHFQQQNEMRMEFSHLLQGLWSSHCPPNSSSSAFKTQFKMAPHTKVGGKLSYPYAIAVMGKHNQLHRHLTIS